MSGLVDSPKSATSSASSPSKYGGVPPRRDSSEAPGAAAAAAGASPGGGGAYRNHRVPSMSLPRPGTQGSSSRPGTQGGPRPVSRPDTGFGSGPLPELVTLGPEEMPGNVSFTSYRVSPQHFYANNSTNAIGSMSTLSPTSAAGTSVTEYNQSVLLGMGASAGRISQQAGSSTTTLYNNNPSGNAPVFQPYRSHTGMSHDRPSSSSRAGTQQQQQQPEGSSLTSPTASARRPGSASVAAPGSGLISLLNPSDLQQQQEPQLQSYSPASCRILSNHSADFLDSMPRGLFLTMGKRVLRFLAKTWSRNCAFFTQSRARLVRPAADVVAELSFSRRIMRAAHGHFNLSRGDASHILAPLRLLVISSRDVAAARRVAWGVVQLLCRGAGARDVEFMQLRHDAAFSHVEQCAATIRSHHPATLFVVSAPAFSEVEYWSEFRHCSEAQMHVCFVDSAVFAPVPPTEQSPLPPKPSSAGRGGTAVNNNNNNNNRSVLLTTDNHSTSGNLEEVIDSLEIFQHDVITFPDLMLPSDCNSSRSFGRRPRWSTYAEFVDDVTAGTCLERVATAMHDKAQRQRAVTLPIEQYINTKIMERTDKRRSRLAMNYDNNNDDESNPFPLRPGSSLDGDSSDSFYGSQDDYEEMTRTPDHFRPGSGGSGGGGSSSLSRSSSFSSDDGDIKAQFDITRRRRLTTRVRKMNVGAVALGDGGKLGKDASSSDGSSTVSRTSSDSDDSGVDLTALSARRRRFQTKVPHVFGRDWKSLSGAAPTSLMLLLHSASLPQAVITRNNLHGVITAIVSNGQRKEVLRVEGTASFRGCLVFDRIGDPASSAMTASSSSSPGGTGGGPASMSQFFVDAARDAVKDKPYTIAFYTGSADTAGPQTLFAKASLDLSPMFVSGDKRKLWLRVPVQRTETKQQQQQQHQQQQSGAFSAVSIGSVLVGMIETFKLPGMSSSDRGLVLDMAATDGDELRAGIVSASANQGSSVLAVKPSSLALCRESTAGDGTLVEVLHRGGGGGATDLAGTTASSILVAQDANPQAALERLAQYGAAHQYQVRIERSLFASDPFCRVPICDSLSVGPSSGFVMFGMVALYCSESTPSVSVYDDDFRMHRHQEQDAENDGGEADDDSFLVWSSESRSNSNKHDSTPLPPSNASALWFFNVADGSSAGSFVVSAAQTKRLRFSVTASKQSGATATREAYLDVATIARDASTKRATVIFEAGEDELDASVRRKSMSPSHHSPSGDSAASSALSPAGSNASANTTATVSAATQDAWVLSLFVCKADYDDELFAQHVEEMNRMLEQQSGNMSQPQWHAVLNDTRALTKGKASAGDKQQHGMLASQTLISPYDPHAADQQQQQQQQQQPSGGQRAPVVPGPFIVVSAGSTSQEGSDVAPTNTIALFPVSGSVLSAAAASAAASSLRFVFVLVGVSVPRHSGPLEVTVRPISSSASSSSTARVCRPHHRLMLPNALMPFDVLVSHVVMGAGDAVELTVHTSKHHHTRRATINNWRELVKSSSGRGNVSLPPSGSGKGVHWRVQFCVLEATEFESAMDALYANCMNNCGISCYYSNSVSSSSSEALAAKQTRKEQEQLKLVRAATRTVSIEEGEGAWTTLKLFSVSGFPAVRTKNNNNNNNNNTGGGEQQQQQPQEEPSALLELLDLSAQGVAEQRRKKQSAHDQQDQQQQQQSPLARRSPIHRHQPDDPSSRLTVPVVLGSAVVADSRQMHVALRRTQFPLRVRATYRAPMLSSNNNNDEESILTPMSETVYEASIEFASALQFFNKGEALKLELQQVSTTTAPAGSSTATAPPQQLTARVVVGGAVFAPPTPNNKFALLEHVTRNTVSAVERIFRSQIEDLERPAHEESFNAPALVKDALAARNEKMRHLRLLVFNDEDQALKEAEWVAGGSGPSGASAGSHAVGGGGGGGAIIGSPTIMGASSVAAGGNSFLSPSSFLGSSSALASLRCISIATRDGEVAVQNMDGDSFIDRITLRGAAGYERVLRGQSLAAECSGNLGLGEGSSSSSKKLDDEGTGDEDEDENANDNSKLAATDAWHILSHRVGVVRLKFESDFGSPADYPVQLESSFNAGSGAYINSPGASPTTTTGAAGGGSSMPPGFVVLTVHSVWGLPRSESSTSGGQGNREANVAFMSQQEVFFSTHAYIGANSTIDFPNHAAIPSEVEEMVVSVESQEGYRWFGAVDLFAATQQPFLLIPVTMSIDSPSGMPGGLIGLESGAVTPARGSPYANGHAAAAAAVSPTAHRPGRDSPLLPEPSSAAGSMASGHAAAAAGGGGGGGVTGKPGANNNNVRAFVLVLCAFARYPKSLKEDTQRRRERYREIAQQLNDDAAQHAQRNIFSPMAGASITGGGCSLRPVLLDIAIVHKMAHLRSGVTRASPAAAIMPGGASSSSLSSTTLQLCGPFVAIKTHIIRQAGAPLVLRADAAAMLAELEFVDAETTESLLDGLEISTGLVDRAEQSEESVVLTTPVQRTELIATPLRFDMQQQNSSSGSPTASIRSASGSQSQLSPLPSEGTLCAAFVMLHSCFFFNVDDEYAGLFLTPVVVEARVRSSTHGRHHHHHHHHQGVASPTTASIQKTLDAILDGGGGGGGGNSVNSHISVESDSGSLGVSSRGLNSGATAVESHGVVHRWSDACTASFIHAMDSADPLGEVTVEFSVYSSASSSSSSSTRRLLSSGSLDVSVVQLTRCNGRVSVVDLSPPMSSSSAAPPPTRLSPSALNHHGRPDSPSSDAGPGQQQQQQQLGFRGELRISLALLGADRATSNLRDRRLAALDKTALRQRRIAICNEKNTGEDAAAASEAMERFLGKRRFRVVSVDRVLVDGVPPALVDAQSQRALTMAIGARNSPPASSTLEEKQQGQDYDAAVANNTLSHFSLNSRSAPVGSNSTLVPIDRDELQLAICGQGLKARHFASVDQQTLVGSGSPGAELPSVSVVPLKNTFNEKADAEATVTVTPVDYLHPNNAASAKELDKILGGGNKKGGGGEADDDGAEQEQVDLDDFWFTFVVHSASGLIPRSGSGEKRDVFVAVDDAQGKELHRTNTVLGTCDPVFDLRSAAVLLPLEQWGPLREITVRVLDRSPAGFDAPLGYARLNLHEACEQGYRDKETRGIMQVFPLEPEGNPELLAHEDLGFLRCSVGVLKVNPATKEAMEAARQRRHDEQLRLLEKEQARAIELEEEEGGSAGGRGVSEHIMLSAKANNLIRDSASEEHMTAPRSVTTYRADPVTGDISVASRCPVDVQTRRSGAPIQLLCKKSSSGSNVDNDDTQQQHFVVAVERVRDYSATGPGAESDAEKLQSAAARSGVETALNFTSLVPKLRESRFLAEPRELSAQWEQRMVVDDDDVDPDKIEKQQQRDAMAEEEVQQQRRGRGGGGGRNSRPSVLRCSATPVVAVRDSSKAEEMSAALVAQHPTRQQYISVSLNSMLMSRLAEERLRPGRCVFVTVEAAAPLAPGSKHSAAPSPPAFVQVCTQLQPLKQVTRFDSGRDRLLVPCPAPTSTTPLSNTAPSPSIVIKIFVATTIENTNNITEPVNIGFAKLDLPVRLVGPRSARVTLFASPKSSSSGYHRSEREQQQQLQAKLGSASDVKSAKEADILFTTALVTMSPEQIAAELLETSLESEAVTRRLDEEADNALLHILHPFGVPSDEGFHADMEAKQAMSSSQRRAHQLRIVDFSKCEVPAEFERAVVRVSRESLLQQQQNDDVEQQDQAATTAPLLVMEGDVFRRPSRVTEHNAVFNLEGAVVAPLREHLSVFVEGVLPPPDPDTQPKYVSAAAQHADELGSKRELLLADSCSDRDMTMSRDGTLLPQTTTKRSYNDRFDERQTKGNIHTALTLSTVPVMPTPIGMPGYHDGWYVLRVASLSHCPMALMSSSSASASASSSSAARIRPRIVMTSSVKNHSATTAGRVLHSFVFPKAVPVAANVEEEEEQQKQLEQSGRDQNNKPSADGGSSKNHLELPYENGISVVRCQHRYVTLRLFDADDDNTGEEGEPYCLGETTLDLALVSQHHRSRCLHVHFKQQQQQQQQQGTDQQQQQHSPSASVNSNFDFDPLTPPATLRLVCVEVELPLEQRALQHTNVAEHFLMPSREEFSDLDSHSTTVTGLAAMEYHNAAVSSPSSDSPSSSPPTKATIPLLGHAALNWMVNDYFASAETASSSPAGSPSSSSSSPSKSERRDLRDMMMMDETVFNPIVVDAVTGADFSLYDEDDVGSSSSNNNDDKSASSILVPPPPLCPIDDPSDLEPPACRFRLIRNVDEEVAEAEENKKNRHDDDDDGDNINNHDSIKQRQEELDHREQRSAQRQVHHLFCMEQYERDHIAHEYIHQLLLKLTVASCWVTRSASADIPCVLRYRQWAHCANRSDGVVINTPMLNASLFLLDHRFREFYHPTVELMLLPSLERKGRIELEEDMRRPDGGDASTAAAAETVQDLVAEERLERVNLQLAQESAWRGVLRQCGMSTSRLQHLKDMGPFVAPHLLHRPTTEQRQRGITAQQQLMMQQQQQNAASPQRRIVDDSDNKSSTASGQYGQFMVSPPAQPRAASAATGHHPPGGPLGHGADTAFAPVYRPSSASAQSASLLSRLRRHDNAAAARSVQHEEGFEPFASRRNKSMHDEGGEEDEDNIDRDSEFGDELGADQQQLQEQHRKLLPRERILAPPAPYLYRGLGATELELAFSAVSFQLAHQHLERYGLTLDLHLLNESVHIVAQRLLAREPTHGLLSPLTAVFGQPKHVHLVNQTVAKALLSAWRARYPMVDLYKDDPSSDLLQLLQRRQALSGGGPALRDALCALVSQTALRIGVEVSTSRAKRTIFNLQRLLRGEKLEGVVPLSSLLNAASQRTESLRQSISLCSRKASPLVVLRHKQCEALEAAILLEMTRLARARAQCNGELHVSYETLKYIVFGALRTDSPAQVEATPPVYASSDHHHHHASPSPSRPGASPGSKAKRKGSVNKNASLLSAQVAAAATGSPSPLPLHQRPISAQHLTASTLSVHNTVLDGDDSPGATAASLGPNTVTNFFHYTSPVARAAQQAGALLPEMMTDLEFASSSHHIPLRPLPKELHDLSPHHNPNFEETSARFTATTRSRFTTHTGVASTNMASNNNNNGGGKNLIDLTDGRVHLFEDPFEVIFVLLHEIILNGAEDIGKLPESVRHEPSVGIPWQTPTYSAVNIDKLPLMRSLNANKKNTLGGADNNNNNNNNVLGGAGLLKRTIASRAPHSFYRSECAFNYLSGAAFESSKYVHQLHLLNSIMDEQEGPTHQLGKMPGTNPHPFTRVDLVQSHSQPSHVHAAVRLLLDAADAPPQFAGHTNPVTGLQNWIESAGPKFVLGQLLLPRSAEVFTLSLPTSVISGAMKLCVSGTPLGGRNSSSNTTLSSPTPPPPSSNPLLPHLSSLKVGGMMAPVPPSTARDRDMFRRGAGELAALPSSGAGAPSSSSYQRPAGLLDSGHQVLLSPNANASFTSMQDVFAPSAVDTLSPDVTAAITSVTSVHVGLGRALALTTAAAMVNRME